MNAEESKMRRSCERKSRYDQRTLMELAGDDVFGEGGRESWCWWDGDERPRVANKSNWRIAA